MLCPRLEAWRLVQLRLKRGLVSAELRNRFGCEEARGCTAYCSGCDGGARLKISSWRWRVLDGNGAMLRRVLQAI